MHIVAITSSFPRRTDDVAGRFVHEWCDGLAGRGHVLETFCWRDVEPADFKPKNYWLHRVSYAPRSWETLFYGAGTPENLRENPLRAVLAFPAIVGMIAEALPAAQAADVVVGHWLLPGGLVARVLQSLTGTPSVVVGHSAGFHFLSRMPRPVRDPLADYLFDGAVTAPSRELLELASDVRPRRRRSRSDDRGDFGARWRVLPMGFHPVGARSNGPDVLSMGRLVEIKGIDLAIEAFASSELDATLHIAGDGPLRRELEQLTGRTEADVAFHGFVTGREKRNLFERCGAFVLPSRRLDGRHEGLPVSLLEACHAGLVPVVSTDIPGAQRLLADAELQRVEGRDPSVWANAIRRVRDGRADLVDDTIEAGRRFTWERLAPRWDAVLEAAAGAARIL